MIIAEELSQAIANEWDHIVLALGTDREAFEQRLTPLLRRLESVGGPDQAATSRSILELFKEYNSAYERLLQAISWLAKGVATPAGSVKKDRYTTLPVFYATDRAVVDSDGGPVSYSGRRGELSLGLAEVSIPDDHRMAKIEKPRVWRLEFREDPRKHVVVLGFEALSLTEFTARARSVMNQTSKKEVLLFVHGYNVGFADALCRTAQIAYDLHFEGLPALYSWPSEGSLPQYVVDETNVMWSRPHFAQVLGVLRERLGAEAIHIIAHSMGNRLVAEVVASITAPVTLGGAAIGQIVFAAPDIDAATFKDLASAFKKRAERFTLYASSEDKAIKASKVFHKYPRAGDSGPGLIVMDTVDTVDATAIDTGLMGHSYYGDNRSVLTDVFELIRRGSPPEERFGLVPKERYGARYWLFSP